MKIMGIIFILQYWLDLEKPLHRQVGLSLVDPLLRFCVKFYTPDPSQLEEEFTRYLFCLQIKRDLAQGHTQCNDNTAALMASYIVQGERIINKCLQIRSSMNPCCRGGGGGVPIERVITNTDRERIGILLSTFISSNSSVNYV